MATQKVLLSTEMVNGHVEDSGTSVGSASFSVRLQRQMPDFCNSVKLKYMMLSCSHLVNHGIYLVTVPLLLLAFGLEIGKQMWSRYDVMNACYILGFLLILVYVYLDLSPRSTYLVDFACYRPPEELKITKSEFINLAKKSGNFDDAAIEFQKHVLMKSGIGDESYMPRSVFLPATKSSLKESREEAAAVMFGAIDDLLVATRVRPKEISILVVNCGIFNTIPSLSAMVINHYKFRVDVHSFNLGGMGCAAGIIAIDLARDLLDAHPGTYALVVSTEIVTSTWYAGKDMDLLLPNCFFRMGAAAVLLSNRRSDQWRSKYQLKQLVRTHTGADNLSYRSIYRREDAERKQGLFISRDLFKVASDAIKAHMTTLNQLALPTSKQLLFFKIEETKPFIPNNQLAFEHICILASSKRALDELQRNLKLSEDYMEASRKTLERFGNTSSSSVWYELAYLEANSKVKKGDRVWQLAFGSGFKCNSVVWKALWNFKKPEKNPWIQDSS